MAWVTLKIKNEVSSHYLPPKRLRLFGLVLRLRLFGFVLRLRLFGSVLRFRAPVSRSGFALRLRASASRLSLRLFAFRFRFRTLAFWFSLLFRWPSYRGLIIFTSVLVIKVRLSPFLARSCSCKPVTLFLIGTTTNYHLHKSYTPFCSWAVRRLADLQTVALKALQENFPSEPDQETPSLSSSADRITAEDNRATPPSPPARVRQRLPFREREKLQDRVVRTACDIAQRREGKKKYAARKKANKYKCKLCNVYLNSAESRTAHYNGSRHKSNARREREGLQSCAYCSVTVRTKSEFERHLQSRRHKRTTKHKYGLLDSY